jgi:hypothetical protein
MLAPADEQLVSPVTPFLILFIILVLASISAEVGCPSRSPLVLVE